MTSKVDAKPFDSRYDPTCHPYVDITRSMVRIGHSHVSRDVIAAKVHSLDLSEILGLIEKIKWDIGCYKMQFIAKEVKYWSCHYGPICHAIAEDKSTLMLLKLRLKQIALEPKAPRTFTDL